MSTLTATGADRINARSAALAEQWQAKADAATDPEQRAACQTIADQHAARAVRAGMRIGRA